MMMGHQHEVSSEEETAAAGDELRRGPWTVEEDLLLVNYIAAHGEGRWNALARCAGLKRTGKSCRLRWLNYLRPDVRRGNMTAEEQLMILELHGRWGNRWSKIAQHLPGRTDNEIKNYWRTRVQKHAKHLNCDVNSQQFKDLMRFLWMPRLLERIQRNQSSSSSSPPSSCSDLEISCVTVDAGGVACQPPPLAMAGVDTSNGCSMWRQQNQAQMGGGVAAATVTPAAARQDAHKVFDQMPAAETAACWWSETESTLLPGVAGFYEDEVAFLPEFDVSGGESMWGGAGGDDASWYTQMLGL
uniref:Uncharacterized protein n=1 Tax=Leersia perrieri TaxID=77586 RepID=A0A0D9X348_9ORYZ